MRVKRGLVADAQPGLVDQLNGTFDFVENLKGDAENGGLGKIKLDRTLPGRPVIRCSGCRAGGGWTPDVKSPVSVVTGVTWNGTQIVVEHGTLDFVHETEDDSSSPLVLTIVPTGTTYIDTVPHTSAMDA